MKPRANLVRPGIRIIHYAQMQHPQVGPAPNPQLPTPPMFPTLCGFQFRSSIVYTSLRKLRLKIRRKSFICGIICIYTRVWLRGEGAHGYDQSILWLVFGAVVGWLAGLVMNDREGTPLNIVIGIIGTLIGGLLTGYSTISQNVFTLTSLLVSFIGAVILLAIVKLARRGTARSH